MTALAPMDSLKDALEKIKTTLVNRKQSDLDAFKKMVTEQRDFVFNTIVQQVYSLQLKVREGPQPNVLLVGNELIMKLLPINNVVCECTTSEGRLVYTLHDLLVARQWAGDLPLNEKLTRMGMTTEIDLTEAGPMNITVRY
jgi:hypothetical protein